MHLVLFDLATVNYGSLPRSKVCLVHFRKGCESHKTKKGKTLSQGLNKARFDDFKKKMSAKSKVLMAKMCVATLVVAFRRINCGQKYDQISF